MGMRDEITEALIEAFNDPDGLQDAVTEFVGARFASGEYDPETGISGSTVPYSGRGIFGSYEAKDIDGTRILSTDQRLVALQAEVTLIPQVEDTINGLKVVWVGRDPAGATWTLQLRG